MRPTNPRTEGLRLIGYLIAGGAWPSPLGDRPLPRALPDLNIDWPINKLDSDQPLISEKDSSGLTIKQAEKLDFVF